jgi:spore maturation protein SpmA
MGLDRAATPVMVEAVESLAATRPLERTALAPAAS